MKRPLYISALVLVATASACDADAPGPDDEFLFHLTEMEIRDAVAQYAPEADADHVVDQLRAPFDCTRFGAACETLGEDEAYDLLESLWQSAVDRVEPQVLLDELELAAASGPAAAPAPTGLPPFDPIPVPTPSAEEWDTTMCSLGDTEYLLSVGVTVSDLGLLVRGDVSFTGTTSMYSGLFHFVGPLVGDYALAGALRSVPGAVLSSRVSIFPATTYGSLTMSSVSFAGSHEMWGRVELDKGGTCGVIAAEATATL